MSDKLSIEFGEAYDSLVPPSAAQWADWTLAIRALEQESAELREKIQRFGTLAVGYIMAGKALAEEDE